MNMKRTIAFLFIFLSPILPSAYDYTFRVSNDDFRSRLKAVESYASISEVSEETPSIISEAWIQEIFGKTNWTQKYPDNSPRARQLYGMAYDGMQGRVLLFGGYYDPYTIFGDTYTWGGNNWATLTPAHKPAERYFHAMAYDAARGEVVLYGGAVTNWGPISDETWVWDGNDWIAKNPGPGGRYGHAMAYDAAREQVVLFGGNENGDWTNGYRNETWVWDGNDWNAKTPSLKPSPRVAAAMAYDAARGYVVLFGGADSFSADTYYNDDTWVWDGNDWTLKTPLHKPTPRGYHAMAYDAARGQVVLFGGYGGTYKGDTWVWDGNDWTPLTSTNPNPRASHAIAYDAMRGQVVLFGGWDGSTFNDTWVYAGEAYVFNGFDSPIDSQPTVNRAKAGQVIPIKWRITDQSGIPVSDPSSFRSISSNSVDCSTFNGDPTNEIEEPATGNSGLQYLGDGCWQYNWKTSKSYSGQCRVMKLTLDDSSVYKASFRFE